MILKKEKNWYLLIIIFSIIISIFYQYSIVFEVLNDYRNWINYILCLILISSYILYDFQSGKAYLNNLVYMLFMLLIFCVLKKQQLLLLFVFCFAFMHLNPYQTINVYRKAILYAFFINLILAALTHNLYNSFGDAIALGFGNQNTTAYCIEFLLILFSIYQGEEDELKVKKSIQWQFFILISTILTWIVFNDTTATIFIISFEILQRLFQKSNILRNVIIKIIICILPLFLLYSSYWLAINYSSNSRWLIEFDQLLSARLNIWHYYFIRMPISLISNNRIFVISAWGNDYTPHQGAFDGTYAYLLYVIGILFAVIYVIGLGICNYKLIKYKQQVLLALMLSLELIAFSENTPYSYAVSFASIFALLSFHRSWLKGEEHSR